MPVAEMPQCKREYEKTKMDPSRDETLGFIKHCT
jgi:hypothetical protein